MKTFVEEKGNYAELINQKLDAIKFETIVDFDTVINGLGDLVKALMANQIITTPFNSLQDLYENADLYVYPHHVVEFKAFVLTRINEFINQLQTSTVEKKQACIADQQARAASKNAQKQLFTAAVKQVAVEITPLQQTILDKFGISKNTKAAEVKFCVEVKTLAHEMQEIIDSKASYKIDDPVVAACFKKLRTLCMQTFRNDMYIDHYHESRTRTIDLPKIKNLMDNLFLLFNESNFELQRFVADYDKETMLYITFNATDVLALLDKQDLQLQILCFELQWFIPRLSLFVDEDDLRNKIRIKLDGIQRKLGVNNLFTLTNLADAESKLKVLTQLIKFNSQGLFPAVKDLLPRGYDFVAQLAEKIMEIKLICSSGNIKLHDMLKLSNADLLQVLANADEIKDFCKSSSAQFSDMFALSADKITLIFADKVNIQRLIVLTNFYYLPSDYLATTDIESIKKLLAEPSLAVAMFNKNAADVNEGLLQYTLENSIVLMQEKIAKLSETGYTLHVDDLTGSSRLIIEKLRVIGLSFYQCRAIYDELVVLNYNFSKSFYDEARTLSFDRTAIDLRFSRSKATLICGLLEGYISTMQATKFNKQHDLSQAFPSIFNLIKEAEGCTDDVLRCQFILELKDNLTTLVKSLNAGNIHTKHIELFKFINDSNIGNFADKRTGWKKEAAKWVEHLTNDTLYGDYAIFTREMLFPERTVQNEDACAFRDFYNNMYSFKQLTFAHRTYPRHDMGKISYRGENSLFEAVYLEDDKEVIRLLGSRISPLGFNTKNASYYAVAMELANDKIIKPLRVAIIRATAKDLGTFLNANHFQDINAVNSAGKTPLLLAAEQGLRNIVQGLVARGVTADAEQVAALVATKQQDECIINELSIAMKAAATPVVALSNGCGLIGKKPGCVVM